MGVQERGVPKDMPILVRGEIDQPAQIIVSRVSAGSL